MERMEIAMRLTDILRHEHQLILMVLDAAEREARAIAGGGVADADRLTAFVDFIRNFADHCHHAKEEDLLFVRMGEKGFPLQGGPVAVMLHEHELDAPMPRRSLTTSPPRQPARRVREDGGAERLAAYAGLLRQHISKEDNILYPMADRVFSEEDQAALAADFERVERDEIGEGVHQRYEALARELAGG
jgi:hemerythrin-like domain-containing protein